MRSTLSRFTRLCPAPLALAIPAILAAALFVTLLPCAQAQEQPPPAGAEAKAGAPASAEVANRRWEEITKRLGLSAEQAAKFRPVVEEDTKKIIALRQQHMNEPRTPENQQKMMDEIQKIHAETREQVTKILTAAQLAEWDKYRAEFREHMRERMQQGAPQGQ